MEKFDKTCSKITKHSFLLSEINRKIVVPRNDNKNHTFLNKIKYLKSEACGKFNALRFSLTEDDKNFIHNTCQIADIEQVMNYVFSENEFEAWVANAVKDFEYYGVLIDAFKDIVENKDKFKKWYNAFSYSNLGDLFMFAELCYLSSKNNQNDNVYWYLLNAIEENNK